MKKSHVLMILICILLALAGCQQLVPPTDGEDEEAGTKTMEVANLVIGARATGDFSGLEAYLAKDPNGEEVRALLEEHGVFAEPPMSKNVSLTMPPFSNDDVFKNGDVLVCKGSGNPISDIMSLVLVAGYSHGGVLNKALAINADSPCVLSADVDYLTKPEEWGSNGLTYETWNEWKANEIVTVLRSEVPEASFVDPIANVAGLRAGTQYAFLGYPPDFAPFWPIPRANAKYWYCTKVPWRVYNLLDNMNIENNNFYNASNHNWSRFQDSILFSLYGLYLKLLHPFWPSWYIRPKVIDRLKLILMGAPGVPNGDGLISPDELRWGPLTKVKTWATIGDVPGDADLTLVGW